jgi:hypothetical protein
MPLPAETCLHSCVRCRMHAPRAAAAALQEWEVSRPLLRVKHSRTPHTCVAPSPSLQNLLVAADPVCNVVGAKLEAAQRYFRELEGQP